MTDIYHNFLREIAICSTKKLKPKSYRHPSANTVPENHMNSHNLNITLLEDLLHYLAGQYSLWLYFQQIFHASLNNKKKYEFLYSYIYTTHILVYEFQCDIAVLNSCLIFSYLSHVSTCCSLNESEIMVALVYSDNHLLMQVANEFHFYLVKQSSPPTNDIYFTK